MNKTTLTFDQYYKKVKEDLYAATLQHLPEAAIKKVKWYYNKGYNVSDCVSYYILLN